MLDFEFRVIAKPHTAFQIQGPGRTRTMVDRNVALTRRDGKLLPVIPASSLKGRARVYVERLCRTLGQPVCTPPNPATMCPHAGLKCPFCTACRLFGSPWREAAVHFSDLVWTGETGELGIRTHVSISRRTGSAQQDLLRTVEVASAAATLEGYVGGRAGAEDVRFLVAGLTAIEHVGGSKARGLGRVTLQLVDPSPELAPILEEMQ